ncbi:MerR family transcriptional regulator [Arthrobacter sp. D5-1]|uniref:helix-turn-helix domain-containing protein n=1 Tax=Arthrobacter sp. D5-1 TaxID=1477518 RepID=UPI001A98A978|nr:MerR family transcriptional regulator [Arthrobacter sp. D5-1]QSZ51311.1 MerR family transcriptional regulator [Arthrobacter sp. D5-1]
MVDFQSGALTIREETVHIGELAERTALSLRTIRHYDSVGLLHPSARTEGGFRVYSEEDYERLLLIRQARSLGFGLEEIAEMLDVLTSRSPGTPEAAKAELASMLREAMARREALASDLGRADQFIAVISNRMAG